MLFLAEIRQAFGRDHTAKELAEQHLNGPQTSQYGILSVLGDTPH